MKKLVLTALLAVIVFMTGACAVKKIDTSHNTKKIPSKPVTSWDRILNENKLVIGTDGSSLNINLAGALKKEMNIEVETVVYGDFEKVGNALKENKIDMYMGKFPKESPKSIEFLLSEPYLKSTINVISLNEDYVPDKKNHIAAVLKNSAEAMTEDAIFENCKEFNSVGAMFQALKNAQVSCVLLDEVIFENSGYQNSGYFVCDSYPYNLVALFNESDTEIANEMNIYLAKIKASGVAGEISHNYFGKDIIYK